MNRNVSGETIELLRNTEIEEGILVKKVPKSPNDLIKIIKEAIKDNIFFIDFETDRKKKYDLALKIVDSYRKSAFWWGMIPLPFLNSYLSLLSRKRMIKEISSIYEIVVKNRIKEKNNKEYKEYNEIGQIINPIFILLMSTAGILNKKKTMELGLKIVDEFDKEYGKINIIDKYFDFAQKLNQNFDILKEFPILFKQNYWFDIQIHKNNSTFKLI